MFHPWSISQASQRNRPPAKKIFHVNVALVILHKRWEHKCMCLIHKFLNAYIVCWKVFALKNSRLLAVKKKKKSKPQSSDCRKHFGFLCYVIENSVRATTAGRRWRSACFFTGGEHLLCREGVWRVFACWLVFWFVGTRQRGPSTSGWPPLLSRGRVGCWGEESSYSQK